MSAPAKDRRRLLEFARTLTNALLDGRDELDASHYRELLGWACGLVAELCAADIAEEWTAA